MSEEEQLLLEKLSDFRRDLVIAHDSSQKFALKKEIEKIEKRLGEIRNSSSTGSQVRPNSNQNKMREEAPKSISEKGIPQWVFLALGVFFTLLPFATVFIVSCLEDAQYKAIRIVFALGGGFLGGFMLGFITLKTSWLRAGGGLALAILFYLWNPAEGITNDCAKTIKGTVFIDNKTQEGITVKLQQAQRDDKTNSYGIFEMKVNQNDLKPKLDFTFIYSQLYIDTVLTIEKDKVDLTDLKFYLEKGKITTDTVSEINTTETNSTTNQTTLSKPKINYHSVTLQGDYKTVDYVFFDDKKIQPKNGIVKLPNLGEDLKNVKIYFKDTSKQNYDKDINNQVTEIDID